MGKGREGAGNGSVTGHEDENGIIGFSYIKSFIEISSQQINSNRRDAG